MPVHDGRSRHAGRNPGCVAPFSCLPLTARSDRQVESREITLCQRDQGHRCDYHRHQPRKFSSHFVLPLTLVSVPRVDAQNKLALAARAIVILVGYIFSSVIGFRRTPDFTSAPATVVDSKTILSEVRAQAPRQYFGSNRTEIRDWRTRLSLEMPSRIFYGLARTISRPGADPKVFGLSRV
jgi:hypothetical protein